MKLQQKEVAIKFRKSGLSYSEILKLVPVARSTLSLWLRFVALSKKQKQRLTEKKLASALRGAMRKKELRLIRVGLIKNKAASEAEELIRDPLWLAGTMLYWAEGSKEKPWRISTKTALTNMDLNVHKIFIKWVKKYFLLNNRELGYDLYIHENAQINRAKSFWATNLGISENTINVYLKRRNPKPKRRNIDDNYNGVLKILIPKSTDINRKIAGWTEGVIKYLQ